MRADFETRKGADPIRRFSASLGSVWTGIPTPPPHSSPLSNALIYLRHPSKADYNQWACLRAASADFLRPWEPLWGADDLTPHGFRRRLEQYQKDRRSGRALPFLIFRHEDNRLIGGINVSNIRRGICQSASIGYWMGEDFAGHGYMTQTVALLLPYLFDHEGLHRVEAACLPSNGPSMSVLQKCGFQFEGKARSYLCINGNWEDHLLYSVLRSDLQAPNAQPRVQTGPVPHYP
ncbi:GNAT family N-acetyltransferase [Cohaesibacter sp. CAU 1516]|nr:GNAT family N-acetyltransferase [Cohaesibacter sp. CAU 1516]